MGQRKSDFTRSMIGLALLSAGLIVAVAVLDRAGLIPSELRWVAGLVPNVPLVLWYLRISRWLKEVDELERTIHLEALVVQFALTGILVMSYGMLARLRVVPDFRVTEVFPYLWLGMFAFWYFGFWAIRRKYQ
ncbi:MAG: hypothetical protein ACYC2K_02480 [Gemmatimonadales bacterium]